jgi:hypothetical protein
VVILGPDNRVGQGNSFSLANVISGNKGNGVRIESATATVNTVLGNFIGTAADGKTGLGNSGDGVLIQDAPGNIIGGTSYKDRNVISANTGSGVHLVGKGATGNKVLSNYIGTDKNGDKNGLGNQEYGVDDVDAAKNEIKTGTYLDNKKGDFRAKGRGAADNQVQGNLLGSLIIDGAPDNLVGGRDPGDGNVIAGSQGQALTLTGSGATGNVIEGNFIGVDQDGNSLGNSGPGVAVLDQASLNTIGGLAAGAANAIESNGLQGVLVASGTGNAILSNTIYANGRLGIDLVGGSEDAYGVTANHDGGAVPAPNHLQNYPELTAADVVGDTLTVSGVLDGEPGSTYLLEFYANSAPDPSGHGEGEQFLGSTYATAGPDGHAHFTTPPFSTAGLTGPFITATATDPNGDTSEFSADLRAGMPTTTRLGSPANPSVYGESVTFTAEVSPVLQHSGTPGGTVLFEDDGTVLGTGALGVVGGVDEATFSTTALAVGSHHVTAVYEGDNLFTGSTSNAVTQVVDKAATSIGLSISPSSVGYGQGFTFDFTFGVLPPGAGKPTGTVTVTDTFDGVSTPLFTEAVYAPEPPPFDPLPVGTNYLTATYNGDSNFAKSTSAPAEVVVTPLVSVDLDSLVNANLQTYTDGSYYPLGGTSVTVGGIPFTLAHYSGGGTGILQTSPASQSSPSSFDIPVNIPNASVVYTLINSAFGQLGYLDGTVVFHASNGATATFDLVQGTNIRDHYNGMFNNEIAAGTPSISFGGGVRLDEQIFVLPSSFAGATLTDIELNGFGDYPTGQPFLAAITVVTSA